MNVFREMLTDFLQHKDVFVWLHWKSQQRFRSNSVKHLNLNKTSYCSFCVLITFNGNFLNILSWEWDGQDAALNVILGSRGWCKNRWSTSNCKTSDVTIFDAPQSTNQMIADDFLNITFQRVIDAVFLCPLSLVYTENPNRIWTCLFSLQEVLFQYKPNPTKKVLF